MPLPARFISCCVGEFVTLVRKTSLDFQRSALERELKQLLTEQMKMKSGYFPSPAEQRSWENSLPILAEDLREAGLSGIEVLLEFQLPLTSRRVDVVLAGNDPKTKQPSYVLVELKQWSSAAMFDGSTSLVTVPGMPGGPKTHPVLQVSGYCEYLCDFAAAIKANKGTVRGVAYLHNAPASVAQDLSAVAPSEYGSLFTSADRDRFRTFLRTHLDAESSGGRAADILLKSDAKPTPQLLAVVADQLKQRDQFVLLDQQRAAFDLVLHEVNRAFHEDQKRIVVVTGGPGSGKSVIAVSLVGEMAEMGRTVLHATGSRSFTTTLRKVAGYGQSRASSVFKYFNAFMEAKRNSIDVLIMDEAHRIRETSVDRYTKAALRTGRSQLDELVSAARVPVFLLDEHQVVRPGEMGSVQEIQEYAKSVNLEVVRVDLEDQFRCGGSDAYIDWVLKLLGLTDDTPTRWDLADHSYALEVADSPTELEAVLRTKINSGFNARMTAGFCWPWSDANKDGSLIPDVVIGDWARPWNAKSERALGDVPPSTLWATARGGFGQVGCIYTAQGFEYDWNGVIFGPDMVRRNGSWVFVREANKDPDFRSRTKVSDQEFERLVRNVYKVLLTRGMHGVVLHSVDSETQAFLKSLVRG